MDRIQAHPWFIRKAPRAVGTVVNPPTPEQIERPIGTADTLDPDILNNLRTLWHGMSEDEIVAALTSREYASFSNVQIVTAYADMQEIMAKSLLHTLAQISYATLGELQHGRRAETFTSDR